MLSGDAVRMSKWIEYWLSVMSDYSKLLDWYVGDGDVVRVSKWIEYWLSVCECYEWIYLAGMFVMEM